MYGDHYHGNERRLTIRLLAYWEKLRAGRDMPTEQDIDPDDIRELWDSCFLIHVRDLDKPDYNYTYLGTAIEDAYTHGLSSTDPGIVSPNARKLTPSYAQVTDSRRPVMIESEFVNLHNERVLYRQCLLPLGEAGRVQAIFGGMRCKIVHN